MNPATGALYERMSDASTKRVDDGPPEPTPTSGLAPVRVASAVHRNGVHVVDEDAPDSTLCGAEIAFVFRAMPERKVSRPCRKCQRELRELVDAGEWTGPTDG